MNLFITQKHTHRQREQTYSQQYGGEIDWEFGIDMYKLKLKIDNQQRLTVEHRKVAQYSIISIWENNLKNIRYIYMYMGITLLHT